MQYFFTINGNRCRNCRIEIVKYRIRRHTIGICNRYNSLQIAALICNRHRYMINAFVIYNAGQCR